MEKMESPINTEELWACLINSEKMEKMEKRYNYEIFRV